jgi:hypothetical protein
MWALLTLGAAVPSFASAQGSLYHERDVTRGATATWSSCPDAAVGETCTVTQILAFQRSVFVKDPDDFAGTANGHSDCAYFSQLVGLKNLGGSDFTPTGLVEVKGDPCANASVNVAASLMKARVEAEPPAQRCDLTTYPETCVDTSPLRLSLDWQPSGDVFRALTGNPIERFIDRYERCLYHFLPGRFVNAAVTGEIDGLADALGPPIRAYLEDSGEIWLGTSHDCLD